MPDKPQSYFGDVMKKLEEMAQAQEITINETLKARLKAELIATDKASTHEPDIVSTQAREPSFSHVVVKLGTGLTDLFRKWQALIIGIPALTITIIVVVFFNRGDITDFEKRYNVEFVGPFSVEEKLNEFKPILMELLEGRNSEALKVVKKNSDQVVIELLVDLDGQENFVVVKEGVEWFGKIWEHLKVRS